MISKGLNYKVLQDEILLRISVLLILIGGFPISLSIHVSAHCSYMDAPLFLQTQQEKKDATEQLGKALEYFTSQKYHECLMIMQELDKQYRLNPRYKAYLGVCYYYEWDYKHATQYLSEALPQLTNFSPHERSFYYWANAESLFDLQKYTEAIPSYEAMLPLCYDNERPDAYYRLGFCYLFIEDWNGAWNYLLKAQDAYRLYRNTVDVKARTTQIDHMLEGLKPKVVSGVIERLLPK